jgi:hypothetical protein
MASYSVGDKVRINQFGKEYIYTITSVMPTISGIGYSGTTIEKTPSGKNVETTLSWIPHDLILGKVSKSRKSRKESSRKTLMH